MTAPTRREPERPACMWCGRLYEEHEESRDSRAPVPKVLCLLLRSGFTPRDNAPAPSPGSAPEQDVAKWVPVNCRLTIDFESSSGTWSGSLRLINDYLGYLATIEGASSPATAIARVREEFLRGPGDSVTKQSYFRAAAPPLPKRGA